MSMTQNQTWPKISQVNWGPKYLTQPLLSQPKLKCNLRIIKRETNRAKQTNIEFSDERILYSKLLFQRWFARCQRLVSFVPWDIRGDVSNHLGLHNVTAPWRRWRRWWRRWSWWWWLWWWWRWCWFAQVPMQIKAVKFITNVSDPLGLNSAIANVKERKILPSSQS